MGSDEIKLRIVGFCNGLVDKLFPANDVPCRLKNTAAKLIIECNAWRLDDILLLMSDKSGDIDVEKIITEFENTILKNGELSVSVRDIIPDDYSFVRNALPDKMILLNRDDIRNIFSNR